MVKFESINRGYNSVFVPGELSIGITVPIEHYPIGSVPTMQDQLSKAKLAEEQGFKAVWTRDIPLNVPAFGDVGQMFDPFTYLGYLSAQTKDIALGISSIALPLHHPLHVVKAAATIDQLSGGRMILGLASGDRPDEYPAMGIEFRSRGEQLREAIAYLRAAQEKFPKLDTTHHGCLNGEVDILPKAFGHKLPILITGHSRQKEEWIAKNSDGWMYYNRNPSMQRHAIAAWRKNVSEVSSYDKPFMQATYLILHPDPDFPPRPIQLGFHTGIHFLNDFFQSLKEIGVNHVALNLRFNELPMEKTMEILAKEVLPNFHK